MTELSQPPDRGSCETSCGARARTKNGRAKTVENASIPRMGYIQSPCAAITSSVPTNGAVHVKEVSENTNPISSTPATLPDSLPRA